MQKADLASDDRATLLGTFLELAGQLREQPDERQEEAPASLQARWRRRGLRAFDADNAGAAE